MTLGVLTAVPGAQWESDVVAALDRATLGVRVVRRCVDLPDLLAAAATGTARAALLSPDLRRLDREALSRLAASRVAVVGLVAPGDDPGAARLRALGVHRVLPADAAADEICAAVVDAVREGTPAPAQHGRAAAGPASAPAAPQAHPAGRLWAVWGPTGAPGRTFVAVNLAWELSMLRVSTLLADADVYGGVVAAHLGLLDESPGLAAATRLANAGRLDLAGLASVVRVVPPSLRVLTGISRAERWPEIRPAALEVVWPLARALAEVTVVDCAFCLERDEDLTFDTAAPRRNGVTLDTLAAADTVLAVGSGDPVALQRLVRGLSELREAVPGARVRVVLNRVRPAPVGRDPARRLTDALARYAGVDPADVTAVPFDAEAADTALARGTSLAEVAPRSPARLAVATLAATLAGRPPPAVARPARWRPPGVRPLVRAPGPADGAADLSVT